MVKLKNIKYDIKCAAIVLFVLLLIVAAGRELICRFADFPHEPVRVEMNYNWSVGIRTLYRQDYDWFTHHFGEPDSRQLSDNSMTADFGRLSVTFSADGEDKQGNKQWRYSSFTTCDKSHRFTIWRVGVGSSREQVRWAYRLTMIAEKENEDIIFDGNGFVDYYVAIFAYDENGIVTSVNVGRGA